MREVLTISKRWKHPKILTRIDISEDGGLEMSLDLKDFLESLKIEIGSVATVLTKGQFDAKFDSAVQEVLKGIKKESNKVVARVSTIK